MSTEKESEEPTSCANCGKSEEEADKLNRCSACKLVKYCGRDCQIAHRRQHKKECRKRAAELHDEELFKQPPKADDCPICLMTLPSTERGQTFMPCCGKSICCGCCHAQHLQSNGGISTEGISTFTCPFCRALSSSSNENMKKRADANDADATFQLGLRYFIGYQYSYIKKDQVKAVKLLHRAAELGSTPAYGMLADIYNVGDGVSKDEAKSRHYYELAAMAGEVHSRFNLGCIEYNAGNFDRAVKHWLIGASFGDIRAVNHIEKAMINGNATRINIHKLYDVMSNIWTMSGVNEEIELRHTVLSSSI